MTDSAATWDAIYASGRAVRTWPSEDVVRFCTRRLQPDQRVLEAGCGNGSNLWMLAARGYETLGCDVSDEALGLAEELAAYHGVRGLVSTFHGAFGAISNHLTLPCDAIIDCRASQHLPWSEHEAAYREYFAMLRPGGWLFLLHLDDETSDAAQATWQTPGERWTWDDIDAGVYPHNGLVCMPPRGALSDLLLAAGFRVDRCEELRRIVWGDGLTTSHTAFDAQRPPG